jgi:hypothetical protein
MKTRFREAKTSTKIAAVIFGLFALYMLPVCSSRNRDRKTKPAGGTKQSGNA